MKTNEFDFSVLNDLSTAFVENQVVHIIYGGKQIPVEIAIKPSEAFVSMESNPLHNNGILHKVLAEVINNPEVRKKMNGRKMDELSSEFNEIELLGMLDQGTASDLIEQNQIEQNKLVEKNRISNRRIVINCAVRPRFIETEKFEDNKSEYVKTKEFIIANPDFIPTFPVELIDDFWLQTLADSAIGKRVIWGEKAEAIGKSIDENDNTEDVAERGASSDTGEVLEDTTT